MTTFKWYTSNPLGMGRQGMAVKVRQQGNHIRIYPLDVSWHRNSTSIVDAYGRDLDDLVVVTTKSGTVHIFEAVDPDDEWCATELATRIRRAAGLA